MTPDPTSAIPSRPAPARTLGPPRRPLGWLVVQWGLVAGIAALVVGAILAWVLLRPHLMTMSHLRLVGATVDWDVDADDWRKGGTTSVKIGGTSSLSNLRSEELAGMVDLFHVVSLDLTGWMSGPEPDMSFLSRLTDLEELRMGRVDHGGGYVYGPAIADRDLANIAGFARLTDLSLRNAEIHGEGLAHLGKLSTLMSLDLAGTPLTDAGLEALPPLPALRAIDLDGTRITDAGLDALAKHPKLFVVSLRGTKVTADGVGRFLANRGANPEVPQIEVDDDIARALPGLNAP